MLIKIIENLKNFLGVLFFVVISLLVLDKLGFGLGLDIQLFSKVMIILVFFLVVLIFWGGAELVRRNKKEIQERYDLVKNTSTKFVKRKLVKLYLLPLCLFLLGLGMSLVNLYNSEESLLVLIQDQKGSNLVFWKTDELLRGEKVEGEFGAYEDNLGIIAVRFNTFERINDDILIFRLREKGMERWYYENRYKTDQFQPNELFPFGFSKINDSKGKIYQFEIESSRGEVGNAVSIGTRPPVFRSKYEFEREKISANLSELIKYIFKKSYNMLHNYVFLLSSFVFFIPLFFYLFYLLKKKTLYNFKALNAFSSIAILTFLAVLSISYQGEFLSNLFGKAFEADSYWNFPTYFYAFWIVFLLIVRVLKIEKS